jgi:hypothetical protein
MSDRSRDPLWPAWKWALRRGVAHVDRLLVGGVGAFLAATGGRVWLTDNVFLLFVIGIVGAFVAAYGWAFIRAPYEQRNALRTTLGDTEQQIRTAEERRVRLRTARKLKGETFYVWELFEPDSKPIVANRTFRNCTIKGPALIGPIRCRFSRWFIGKAGSADSLLYEMVPGERIGIFGFVHCAFLDCRFEHIGYYADKEFSDEVRKAPML